MKTEQMVRKCFCKGCSAYNRIVKDEDDCSYNCRIKLTNIIARAAHKLVRLEQREKRKQHPLHHSKLKTRNERKGSK